MTRALGSFHLRDSGVVSTPSIMHGTLDGERDCFLLLGTDGVFDFATDSEATSAALGMADAADAAFTVCENSLFLGSTDNTTAVVLPLPAWDEYRQALTCRKIPGRSFHTPQLRG